MVNWNAHKKYSYLTFQLKQYKSRKRHIRRLLMKVKARKAHINDGEGA